MSVARRGMLERPKNPITPDRQMSAKSDWIRETNMKSLQVSVFLIIDAENTVKDKISVHDSLKRLLIESLLESMDTI